MSAVVLKFVERFARADTGLRKAAEAMLARFAAAWSSSEGRPRPERYAALYSIVDQELAAAKERLPAVVPCVRGCNHCCRFNEILISKWQTVLIVSAIEKLPPQEHASLVARILSSHGRSGGGITSPCALLSPEGVCSVYSQRPLPCRGYFSVSEPACRNRLYAGDADPPTFVTPRIIELAALDVLSAAESDGDRAPMELNSLLRRIYSDPSRVAQWAAGRPSDEPDLVAWPTPVVPEESHGGAR